MKNSIERIERLYVLKTDSCWLWTGSIAPNGYSKTRLNDKFKSGHKAFYESYRGPVPSGMHLDHLCRVRKCVNPDHLEVVTNRENQRRGVGPVGKKMAQTHCIRNHPLSGENLYLTPIGRRRQCKTCINFRSKRLQDRKRGGLFLSFQN